MGNVDSFLTLSGSGSGTTCEYPVSKAPGKIARRVLERCATIVSISQIKDENKHQNEGTDVK